MQLNVDLTVISFIAGLVSLVVGVLAMALSILFYLKSNDLVLETTRTLGEIKQTTRSLEGSVGTIISRTIDYLTGGTPPPEGDLKRAEAAADEILERVKTELGDTELGQKVEELEGAFKELREEYAARIQNAERRKALVVPGIAEWEEFPPVTSKKQYVEGLASRGWQLYLAGALDASIVASRRALRMRPDHRYARANLALALLSKGEKEAALTEYERFIAQSPDTVYIWGAVKDLEGIRGKNVDGVDVALEMLLSAAEAAETRDEEILPEEEIPF